MKSVPASHGGRGSGHVVACSGVWPRPDVRGPRPGFAGSGDSGLLWTTSSSSLCLPCSSSPRAGRCCCGRGVPVACGAAARAVTSVPGTGTGTITRPGTDTDTAGTETAAGTQAPPVPRPAEPPAPPVLEKPPPSAGRMMRLRARLARSQTGFGAALLGLLSRDRLDDDTWDEIEEVLITADVGVTPRQADRVGPADPGEGRGFADPRGGAGHAPRRTARPGGHRGEPGAADAAPRGAAGGHPRGRRQRHGKDDDRAASSPGRWSATARRWCSARPIRSVPRPSTSCRPGETGSARRPSARTRMARTRPASPSRR